jgi:hypothetical protein
MTKITVLPPGLYKFESVNALFTQRQNFVFLFSSFSYLFQMEEAWCVHTTCFCDARECNCKLLAISDKTQKSKLQKYQVFIIYYFTNYFHIIIFVFLCIFCVFNSTMFAVSSSYQPHIAHI